MFPSFKSSSFEYLSALFRFHPGSETVDFDSFCFAGLICSFCAHVPVIISEAGRVLQLALDELWITH